MLARIWSWLVGTRVSEREVVLEALRALRESSMAQAAAQAEQNKTFQAWLSMFQAAQQGPPPQGWVADDHSVAIKEQAQDRGVRLPDALLTGSEQEKIQWLEKQMDGWD